MHTNTQNNDQMNDVCEWYAKSIYCNTQCWVECMMYVVREKKRVWASLSVWVCVGWRLVVYWVFGSLFFSNSSFV